MTNFNQQIATIQTLINEFGLSSCNREDNGSQVTEVRGMLYGRRIYIYVRYATSTITWMDEETKETKVFRF